MNTIGLATASLIGTALVLAPIDPKAIRDAAIRDTDITIPEPTPEPAVVVNFDCYGSLWGYDTATKAEADIAEARANGADINEWNVTDRDGQPLRIVRTTAVDTTFLGGIDICVIPALERPHF